MPHGSISELARGIAQLFFPNACLLCHSSESETDHFRHGLCGACHQALTTDSFSVCPRCAATVGPYSDTAEGCSACRDRSFPFQGVVRLGPYDGLLKQAILRMKYSAGESLAERIAGMFREELSPRMRSYSVDVVIPVPLHWRRRWARGFNLSATLGEEMAKELGAKFSPHALRRVKPATQHTQPSASARMENIRGAFACSSRASLAGRTVLLVDDVMTTGSTASEASRVLKAAGAGLIFVAILARA